MSTESVTASTALPTGTWTVDPIHSNVEFSVKHVGIATVKGRFNEFEGTLQVNPDSGAVGYGTVEVQSVDTGQQQRDDHLRSPDFFDAANFPKIAFRSTDIAVDGEEVTVTGEITIRDVTRTISLQGEIEGTETDHQGNERVGLSLSTQIKRSDFNVSFNAALGSGNLVVSDKVKIQVDVSAVKSA